jgi:hypothetical protein
MTVETADALRRLDWRFLLPAAPDRRPWRRMAILGASSAVLERAENAELAAQITDRVSATDRNSLDVIAVLHGAHEPPNGGLLAMALREGGILYQEIVFPWPAGLVSLARQLARLRQAGLTVTGIYGVRPSFEAAKMYIPTHTPKLLGWYTQNVYTPWSARRLIRARLQDTSLIPAKLRASLYTHNFAILATRGESAVHAPAALVTHESIRDMLSEPTEANLLLTDGGNRVTLLPFSAEGTRPLAVLKVPKLISFNDRTENEQVRLGEIRQALPSGIAASIPTPLGVVSLDGISGGVESFLEGRSFERLSGTYLRSKRKKVRELEAAGEWLSQFHQVSATHRSRWSVERIEEDLAVPFAAFRRTFDATPAEEMLLNTALTEARLLVGKEIPEVWQHRDFNAWNLLIHGEEVRVFDWEGARRGLPLCDLIHLVTHWNDMVRGHADHTRRVEGFRMLFLNGTPVDAVGAGARRVIRRYLEELRLPPSFFPIALVYTWVELALRRRQQQVDGGAAAADPRKGNALLHYVSCLAANRAQLFPREAKERTAPIGEEVRA